MIVTMTVAMAMTMNNWHCLRGQWDHHWLHYLSPIVSDRRNQTALFLGPPSEWCNNYGLTITRVHFCTVHMLIQPLLPCCVLPIPSPTSHLNLWTSSLFTCFSWTQQITMFIYKPTKGKYNSFLPIAVLNKWFTKQLTWNATYLVQSEHFAHTYRYQKCRFCGCYNCNNNKRAA